MDTPTIEEAKQVATDTEMALAAVERAVAAFEAEPPMTMDESRAVDPQLWVEWGRSLAALHTIRKRLADIGL